MRFKKYLNEKEDLKKEKAQLEKELKGWKRKHKDVKDPKRSAELKKEFLKKKKRLDDIEDKLPKRTKHMKSPGPIYDSYLTEKADKKILQKAAELGAEAFKKGLKSTPAQDKKLMKLLKGLPIGGGGAEIMDAWSKAWHKENLK